MTARGTRRPAAAPSPGASVALALARARATAGLPVETTTLPGGVGAERALELAVVLGAPLAPVIDTLAEVDRARARLAAEVRRASAEGRAVATGLVVGPPVLGIATAALVADDPVRVLLSPAGRVLVLLAATLWFLGIAVVVGALRRAAAPRPADDDELFLLAAIAVRAGEPLSAALRRADGLLSGSPAGAGARRSRGPPRPRVRRRTGDPTALALWLDLGAVGDPPAAWGSVAPALSSALGAGVALAPLLDQLAADRRAAAHDDALERAARLGATLAVPTALLLLPAGLLLAAGPLVLAALDQLV